MKLKKIASLLLAGVMAASMLAGCNTTSNQPENPTDPEEPTTSGYTAVLKDNLDSKVTSKKYVSFADNNEDEAALRAALKNVSNQGIDLTLLRNNNLVNMNDWNTHGFEEMIADFADAVKFTDKDDIKESDLSMEWYAEDNYANHSVKDGTLYVIDGSVGVDEAVERVAAKVEQYLEKLPEHDTNDTDNNVWDYKYVVSVSVVNKATDNITWHNASVNVIAVTVTRTVSAG